MLVREHEGDCETTGADGREDNNDGMSGRFMVKKDVCAIYFSLQVPVYWRAPLNAQLTALYKYISALVRFVKENSSSLNYNSL